MKNDIGRIENSKN